jgi:hypothetical protein
MSGGELIEILKRNPHEFGGFQPFKLSDSEVRARMCCARHCSAYSIVQLAIPTGGFRVVCGRHGVLGHMMMLGILGDTSPVGEIREICRILGLDFDAILKSEPKHPTLPENFICLRCGGGYLAETVGMYAGKRYIHTCGE